VATIDGSRDGCVIASVFQQKASKAEVRDEPRVVGPVGANVAGE
jgi:hypothetical protein